jgi:type III secretion protein J
LTLAQIDSSKQREKEGTFSVHADADKFADAVRLLNSKGLPAKRFDTLGEVFAREGFVSSPTEERARLNHALSQEIASTLSSIDGVVLARVHLAIPQVDTLSDKLKPASASVFIKHRKGADLNKSISQIKALVVNGIENLPYDNVTVALFEADDKFQQTKQIRPAVVAVPETISAGVVSNKLALFPGSVSTVGMVAILAFLFVGALAGVRYWRSRHS